VELIQRTLADFFHVSRSDSEIKSANPSYRLLPVAHHAFVSQDRGSSFSHDRRSLIRDHSIVIQARTRIATMVENDAAFRCPSKESSPFAAGRLLISPPPQSDDGKNSNRNMMSVKQRLSSVRSPDRYSRNDEPQESMKWSRWNHTCAANGAPQLRHVQAWRRSVFMIRRNSSQGTGRRESLT
jgi:hypothetical protein